MGLVQFAGLGVSSRLFWPIVFAGIGVALIWRQADDAQRSRWVQASPRVPVVGSLIGTGGWASAARFVLGLALVGGSVAAFVLQRDSRAIYDDVLLGVLLALAGVALIVGPWVFRLTTDLSSERRERVRSQERADIAAHLHDSVLQTLALIQRHADDPPAVATPGPRARSASCGPGCTASDAGDAGRSPAALRGVGRRGRGRPRRAGRGRHGRRRAARRAAAAAGARRPARRWSTPPSTPAPPQVDVYAEVDADAGRGVRPRPRAGLRPRRRCPTTGMGVRDVDRRTGCERHGGTADDQQRPGEGTEVGWRCTADARERGRDADESARSGRARRRPRDVPHRREGRARRRPGRGASARPRTSTRPSRRSPSTQPDVVLLDVHLPGGGGVEVIRRVAPRRTGRPVPGAVGVATPPRT